MLLVHKDVTNYEVTFSILACMQAARLEELAIAQALGRVPKDCKDKHNLLLASRMKQGPFRAEEDKLIRRRVQEWGDRGRGLWVALQEEMGRPLARIRRRWLSTLRTK
jgi:hypothetical protein